MTPSMHPKQSTVIHTIYIVASTFELIIGSHSTIDLLHRSISEWLDIAHDTYQGAGPTRTAFWCGQCTVWNADIFDDTATYTLMIDKYLVILWASPQVRKFVRIRGLWMVNSRLVYQGPPTYLWAQRIARERTHNFGIKSLKLAYTHARRCIPSSIGCTGLRDRMDSWNGTQTVFEILLPR